MKKVYEAWIEDNEEKSTSITLATAEGIEEQKTKGLLDRKAKLKYRIEADTFEEAMAVHHIKMGWSPYKPSGEPMSCPRSCGAIFYPEGSGECPNCGKIC